MKTAHHHHRITKKPFGIALLALGILLFGLGVSASNPFGSDLARFFSGAPLDSTLWLTLAGMASMLTGLMLGSRRTP